MTEIDKNKVYSLGVVVESGWLGLSRDSILRMIARGQIQGRNLNVTGIHKRYGIKGEDIIKFQKERIIK